MNRILSIREIQFQETGKKIGAIVDRQTDCAVVILGKEDSDGSMLIQALAQGHSEKLVDALASSMMQDKGIAAIVINAVRKFATGANEIEVLFHGDMPKSEQKVEDSGN